MESRANRWSRSWDRVELKVGNTGVWWDQRFKSVHSRVFQGPDKA